jgi:ribosome maturation factor RimP
VKVGRIFDGGDGMREIDTLEPLLRKELEQKGIELVDLQYRRENGEQMLRFFVDSPGGVDLELCSQASRLLKPFLDEKDIPYDHLEVSSPGMDRILKSERDFHRFKGERVRIKTLKEYDGPRVIIGILTGSDAGYIEVQAEDQTFSISREHISVARLHPDL